MLCKCYVLSIPIPSDNAENKKFHVWNGYAHDSGPPPAPPPLLPSPPMKNAQKHNQ